MELATAGSGGLTKEAVAASVDTKAAAGYPEDLAYIIMQVFTKPRNLQCGQNSLLLGRRRD